MPKIVVTHPMGLSTQQQKRLEKFGTVTYLDTPPKNGQDWVERCQGFDIVCSWMSGLRENYGQLKNTFISVPFVGVSSFADPKIVKQNKLIICNSPGCNRHAVSEWISYMMLTSMRRLDKFLNTNESLSFPLPYSPLGLAGKRVTILGKGNIGKRVGKICKAFEMKVSFFERGDDLLQKITNADIIVDVLSANASSKNLLNKTFFHAVKTGATFISVTVDSIVDIDAMIAALDRNQLSYVAHDVMNAPPADTKNSLYQRFRTHPRIFATPHIAAFTDVTNTIGNDMMIDNIEAWLNGKPIHVFS